MAGPASRYLDPAVLARLGSLDLRARAVVDGVLSGLHRSPRRGFSVEFAEHRPYVPGDDLQAMDWRVYARTERHYIRTYEAETTLECQLLLDVSASMAYGSHGVRKLDYAACLAASLAYLMHRQRDAVGLITFDDRIVARLPASARAGHLQTLIHALERTTVGRATNLGRPLDDLSRAMRRRGLVVVISDLLDDPRRVVDDLRRFHHGGTEVVVFQVLDPDELQFPFTQAARFRDPETDEEIAAVPTDARTAYLEALETLTATYRREFGGAGIDFRQLDTSAPLDAALLAYLSTRARSR